MKWPDPPNPGAFINDWLVLERSCIRRAGVIGAYALTDVGGADALAPGNYVALIEAPAEVGLAPGNYVVRGADQNWGTILILQGGQKFYVPNEYRAVASWLGQSDKPPG